MKNIGQSSLRRIFLCWPSLAEQMLHAASVVAHLDHSRELKTVVNKLRRTKAGLVTNLVTGRIRIKILEGEDK